MGIIFPTLVEVGLTNLPKNGCVMAHPEPPGITPLRIGLPDLQKSGGRGGSVLCLVFRATVFMQN